MGFVASLLGAFGGGGSASDIKSKIASGKALPLNINQKTGVMKKGIGTGKNLVHGNKKLSVGKGFGAPKATKKAAAEARKAGPRPIRTTPKKKRG